jgi:hypothetical protein
MVVNRQLLREHAYPRADGEVFGHLVAIEHASLVGLEGMEDGVIRVTDIEGTFDADLESFVLEAQGETWYSMPFDVVPPGQSEEEPEGSLVVPNIDRKVGAAVRAIRTAARVTVTPVLLSNPEVSMCEPYRRMELRNIETDVERAEGQLLYTSLETEPFCQEAITESRFPAVFRAAV